MANKFAPFTNEIDVLTVGERSIENHDGYIALVGDWTIERTRPGLAAAKALADTLQRAIDVMTEDAKAGTLPDALPVVAVVASKVVANPF